VCLVIEGTLATARVVAFPLVIGCGGQPGAVERRMGTLAVVLVTLQSGRHPLSKSSLGFGAPLPYAPPRPVSQKSHGSRHALKPLTLVVVEAGPQRS
jgi:hypothetical protein